MSDETRDDNPSAFPMPTQLVPWRDNCNEVVYDVNGHAGMSLRDYFAGQACTGAVLSGTTAPQLARMAYEIADALLAQRVAR